MPTPVLPTGRIGRETLALLMATPGQELHTREIARRVGADAHPVQRALERMLDADLVQSRRLAADALLACDGDSANSHVVRFSYPLLPAVYVSERSVIDRIRSARNSAQYDARDSVPAGLAVQAIQIAQRVLGDVRAVL